MIRLIRPQRERRGVTTVEFALTAPILFMLVIAAIEFSRANMLFHSAAVAASEGARRGIIAGSTADEVADIVRQELSYIGIKESRIAVHPEVVTNDTKLVAVAVQVPVNANNGYVIPRFFAGKSITKVVAMPREAKNDPKMTSQIVAAMETAQEAVEDAPLEGIGSPNGNEGDEGGEAGDDVEGEGGDGGGNGGNGGWGGFGDWLKKIFGW